MFTVILQSGQKLSFTKKSSAHGLVARTFVDDGHDYDLIKNRVALEFGDSPVIDVRTFNVDVD